MRLQIPLILFIGIVLATSPGKDVSCMGWVDHRLLISSGGGLAG